jgi:hypothetical protein
LLAGRKIRAAIVFIFRTGLNGHREQEKQKKTRNG